MYLDLRSWNLESRSRRIKSSWGPFRPNIFCRGCPFSPSALSPFGVSGAPRQAAPADRQAAVATLLRALAFRYGNVGFAKLGARPYRSRPDLFSRRKSRGAI